MVAFYYFLLTLFLIVCLIMMLIILIQKGRGGGLSGSFGGGGGGNTAFGSKTGDVLTWATSIIFGVFLILAVFLNLVANKIGTPTKPPTAAAQHSAPAAP